MGKLPLCPSEEGMDHKSSFEEGTISEAMKDKELKKSTKCSLHWGLEETEKIEECRGFFFSPKMLV